MRGLVRELRFGQRGVGKDRRLPAVAVWATFRDAAASGEIPEAPLVIHAGPVVALSADAFGLVLRDVDAHLDGLARELARGAGSNAEGLLRAVQWQGSDGFSKLGFDARAAGQHRHEVKLPALVAAPSGVALMGERPLAGKVLREDRLAQFRDARRRLLARLDGGL